VRVHASGRLAGHPHAPALHTPNARQGRLHPPQFAASVCVFVQNAPQSSGAEPRHAQAPRAPAAPGFAVAQLVAQEPHASESDWRSRQRGTSPSQRVRLPHWQTPPTQAAPAPQRTPQPPQLFGSAWYALEGSTQAPPQS
jgi:hypothetical protein